MKTSALTVIILLATVASRWALAEAIDFTKLTPASVLVVHGGSRADDGTAHFSAIRITSKKTIRDLETLFPSYRKRPSSEVSVFGIPNYQIYFNFRNGLAIRVMVELHDEGYRWSTGDGHFEGKGQQFRAFVMELTPDIDR